MGNLSLLHSVLELLPTSELSLTVPSSGSRGQQGACLPQRVMRTGCHPPSLMGVCRWLLSPSPLAAWLTGPRPSGPGGLTLPISYRGYSSTSVPHYSPAPHL